MKTRSQFILTRVVRERIGGAEEGSESESPSIPDPLEKLPLSKNIEEGDFVLLKLMPEVSSKGSKTLTKPKYYVAKIISKEDEDGDYEVSFFLGKVPSLRENLLCLTYLISAAYINLTFTWFCLNRRFQVLNGNKTNTVSPLTYAFSL